MRILGGDFVRHYSGRIVNIHPSLLPAFPGLHTHRRALQGRRETPRAATVHFRHAGRSIIGPIIAQAAIPVRARTPSHARGAGVQQEHRIYPLAIRWFVEGRSRSKTASVRVDAPGARQALLVEE